MYSRNLLIILITLSTVVQGMFALPDIQRTRMVSKRNIVKTLSIVIPAYNEEQRIGATLRAYHSYAQQLWQQGKLATEFVVVLNGCKDNTKGAIEKVIQELQADTIRIIDLKEAGKGLAIKAGFIDALKRNNDLIGFLDADMSTKPQHYYELVDALGTADGIIASRYMTGAYIEPKRPWIKRWGSKLIYEPLVQMLLGIKYHDYQCGAKIFTRKVIETIAPHLTVKQWAFDIELLYLCKRFGFKVLEVPTIWFDQAGSKLKLFGPGTKMLSAVVGIWKVHHHR
jgi:glycosyltransferase involved in cell wall biosynthesis